MVWGVFDGAFAARLLDQKFPAPAAMAPADPDGEVMYNKLLRDCVVFRSPTDAVEEVIRPYPNKPPWEVQPKPLQNPALLRGPTETPADSNVFRRSNRKPCKVQPNSDSNPQKDQTRIIKS